MGNWSANICILLCICIFVIGRHSFAAAARISQKPVVGKPFSRAGFPVSEFQELVEVDVEDLIDGNTILLKQKTYPDLQASEEEVDDFEYFFQDSDGHPALDAIPISTASVQDSALRKPSSQQTLETHFFKPVVDAVVAKPAMDCLGWVETVFQVPDRSKFGGAPRNGVDSPPFPGLFLERIAPTHFALVCLVYFDTSRADAHGATGERDTVTPSSPVPPLNRRCAPVLRDHTRCPHISLPPFISLSPQQAYVPAVCFSFLGSCIFFRFAELDTFVRNCLLSKLRSSCMQPANLLKNAIARCLTSQPKSSPFLPDSH